MGTHHVRPSSETRAITTPRIYAHAHTLFRIALILAVAFTAALIVIPMAFPFDPNVTDLRSSLLPPGEGGFLLGSDAMGRDVLLRTIAGGSESVLLAFAVVALAFAIGTIVGLVSGYLGGPVDTVLAKIVVMFQAFPSFVLAIAISAVLGPGVQNMIIAIVAVYWTQFARLARSLAVSLKEADFVRAAKVCGAGPAAIMGKYVLPNLVPPLIVMAMVSIGDAILTMAGLSFLGLGPERPTNEWGAMMNEARSTFQIAPWGIIVPGTALFLAVTVFNLLGDSLRDVLDAHTGRGTTGTTGLPGTSSKSGRKLLNGKEGNNMHTPKMRAGLIAVISAICLAAVCLTGCSSGTSGSSTDNGDENVLYAGSTAYFYAETPDPANNWDGWELQYYGVTENLVRLTDDFSVEPWLAAEVVNVDEVTWEITLRDDIKFSNGKPVTAGSVKACFERTLELNPRAHETLPIASIEADGQTLTIVTEHAVPAFENCLADPIFSVYYTGDDVDYATETPCTGPYKIEEFTGDPDYTATLVPNEYYWDGTPKLDRIVVKTYFDEDSMALAMQNGELDVLAMPAASTYLTLDDEVNFFKYAQTSTRADFVRFNMNHPVVANPAVREAVSWCIDREAYAEVICGGTEVPSYGVYSAQLPYGGWDNLNVTVDSCDVDKAAQVLDEAGIIDTDGDGIRELNGEPVVITLYNCTNYERFIRLADDLQSKLASIGVQLDIVEVDYWLQDSETYAADDPDMTIDSFGMAPTGDASYFANTSFVTGGSSNFGGYSNPEVDELVSVLNTTFDENERAQVIDQISQLVLDDNAYIFFSNSTTNYLAAAGVSGFAVAPSEYYFITVDTTIER